MDKQWIHELRKRFSNRKTAAPDGLWENIEAAIYKQNGIVAETDKKKSSALLIPLWARIAGTVAACIVLTVGIWWFINAHIWEQSGNKSVVSDNVETSIENNHNSSFAHNGTLQEDEQQSLSHNILSKLSSISSSDGQGLISNLSQDNDLLTDVSNTKEYEDTIKSSKIDEGIDKRNNPTYHHNGNNRNGNGNQYLALHKSKSKKKTVEFGFYGAGTSFTGNSSNGIGPSYTTMATVSSDVYGRDKILRVSMEKSNVSETDENEVNVKHRFPLRVGVSVRFKLADRWGIETGMAYSYHSSDIMSGDEYGGYKTVRKLHYVGVPLNISYDIWKNDYLNVYAKMGGMAEFCVSGNETTDYITGNTVTDTSEESVREKRPQWSIDLFPGIQYNFNNTIGVYAEPGIAYYFDNGSGMNTIYKDKKININLNIGLRLTIK